MYQSRYLYLNDVSMLLDIDIDVLHKHMVHTSKLYGRYIPENLEYKYLVDRGMKEEMASPYDFNTILNWDGAVHCIKLFLTRTISSIPSHTGPFNMETFYIIPELLTINNMSILTMDSEPGFFLNGSEQYGPRLQLPYLQIVAPFSRIQKIFNNTSQYVQTYNHAKYLAISNIKDITHDIYKWFPNIQIQENIISIFFIIDYSRIVDNIEMFLQYVLTNTFFEDIINIIKMH